MADGSPRLGKGAEAAVPRKVSSNMIRIDDFKLPIADYELSESVDGSVSGEGNVTPSLHALRRSAFRIDNRQSLIVN
jgi:hypothetical protein